MEASPSSRAPHPLGDVRLSLDVIMEDFWTRPTGVYGKPVWLRPGVLQLFYDDDNTELCRFDGETVPGGHVAFTRTAAVYSKEPLTAADLDPSSGDAANVSWHGSMTISIGFVGAETSRKCTRRVETTSSCLPACCAMLAAFPCWKMA